MVVLMLSMQTQKILILTNSNCLHIFSKSVLGGGYVVTKNLINTPLYQQNQEQIHARGTEVLHAACGCYNDDYNKESHNHKESHNGEEDNYQKEIALLVETIAQTNKTDHPFGGPFFVVV